MIIAIEGMDCSGKTTQTELLKNFLITRYKSSDIETFHFPNKKSLFGSEIYNYLDGKTEYNKYVVELLHTADKMDKQSYLIQFKNNCDKHIILDRYKLSQYAYAAASNLDVVWVRNLMSKMVEPDIKIFLNILPIETVKRKKQLDKYENNIKFLNNVYDWYLIGCDNFEYKIIDAAKSIEEIHHEICKKIDSEFKFWFASKPLSDFMYE